jgi:hypothetical protein
MGLNKQLPEVLLQIDDGPQFKLDPEANIALCSIALRNSLSLEDAIAVSVYNEAFLQEQVKAGGQLLIKQRGDAIRYLNYC